MDFIKIKRALVSVSDKMGIVEFALGLHELKVQILSTGGTAKVLETAGIPTVNVSSVTGYPEMMGGRVKTLHPAIHAGILAVRSNPKHMKELKDQHIEPIDMVAVNLYPFAQIVAKRRTTLAEAIENIDIGGPSMIRSAAKNFHSVAIVVDPKDYQTVLREMYENEGCVSLKARKKFATKAFSHTSEYDRMIFAYFKEKLA